MCILNVGSQQVRSEYLPWEMEAGGIHIRVEKIPTPPYPQISSLTVSPDSKRYAFISHNYTGQFFLWHRLGKNNPNAPFGVIIDGELAAKGTYRKNTDYPHSTPYILVGFSFDGSEYSCRLEECVVNGKPFVVEGYDSTEEVFFLPNNDRLYHVVKQKRHYLVTTNAEYDIPADFSIGDIIVSPDGRNIAYEALEAKYRYDKPDRSSDERWLAIPRYVNGSLLDRHAVSEWPFVFEEIDHVFEYESQESRFAPAFGLQHTPPHIACRFSNWKMTKNDINRNFGPKEDQNIADTGYASTMNKKIVSADNKNYAIIGTRLDTPFPNNHALIVNDKIIWKFKYYESEDCFTFNPNREVLVVRDNRKFYKVDIISDREYASPCWNCPYCGERSGCW